LRVPPQCSSDTTQALREWQVFFVQRDMKSMNRNKVTLQEARKQSVTGL
jgi:ribosomal protein S9